MSRDGWEARRGGQRESHNETSGQKWKQYQQQAIRVLLVYTIVNYI
jgi:hypothetical protein